MQANILILDGHPDPAGGHFMQALADAYAEGARAGGHALRRIRVAELDFPLLRSKADWDAHDCPPGLADAQAALLWATHIVILFPLWLGDMPALLKAFLEQVLRPKSVGGDLKNFSSLLKGRSAHVVVTMGMPAALYRWYFGAHSVRSLERNILGFVGVAPVRHTLIGMVEGPAHNRSAKLEQLRACGRAAR